MKKWLFLGALASFGLMLWTTLKTPLFETESKRHAQAPIKFSDYIRMRRHIFLGHHEMSDLLSAIGVIANTVEMHRAKALNLFNTPEGQKIKARFYASFETISFLAQFRIGMTDLYVLPTLYILFEDEDAETALQYAHYGAEDQRTDMRAPLLAAFVTHVFARQPEKAGEYYYETYKRNQTEWMKDLAFKLKSGDDPFDTDPRVRANILNLINNAFPRAKEFFEKNQRAYEERKLRKQKPATEEQRP